MIVIRPTNTFAVLLGFVVWAVLYIGAGALFHALILGDEIDWTSAWSLGILIGWPAALIGGIALACIAVTIVVVIVVSIDERVAAWRRRRERRQAHQPFPPPSIRRRGS